VPFAAPAAGASGGGATVGCPSAVGAGETAFDAAGSQTAPLTSPAATSTSSTATSR